MRNVTVAQNDIYEFSQCAHIDHSKIADLIIASALIVTPGYNMPRATKSSKEVRTGGVTVFGEMELQVLKSAEHIA